MSSLPVFRPFALGIVAHLPRSSHFLPHHPPSRQCLGRSVSYPPWLSLLRRSGLLHSIRVARTERALHIQRRLSPMWILLRATGIAQPCQTTGLVTSMSTYNPSFVHCPPLNVWVAVNQRAICPQTRTSCCSSSSLLPRHSERSTASHSLLSMVHPLNTEADEARLENPSSPSALLPQRAQPTSTPSPTPPPVAGTA